MSSGGGPAKSISAARAHADLDSLYQHLKAHDRKWLEKTLRSRWQSIRPQAKPPPRPQYTPVDDGIGPFDVTAAELNPKHIGWSHVANFRAFDWASTELGPMASWQLDLRRMINICFADPRAAAFWWGENRLCFWNEAYQPTLGEKDPWPWGKPFPQVWPDVVDPVFLGAFSKADTTGLASSGDDACFFVNRRGFLEELWACWSIIPVTGSGGIVGYYNSVIEVTRQILHERRMKTVLAIERLCNDATTLAELWKCILNGIAVNPEDVPFAVLYSAVSTDHQGMQSDVVPDSSTRAGSISSRSCSSNLPSNSTSQSWLFEGVLSHNTVDGDSLPTTLSSEIASTLFGPFFSAALGSRKPQVLRVDDGTFPEDFRCVAKSRAWGDDCTTAVLLPISSRKHTCGFVLLGLSPRVAYDGDYQQFVGLLSRQMASSLAAVLLTEDEERNAREAARLAAQERVWLSKRLAASQQEAKSNELRFRTMAQNAPVGMFEVAESGQLLYANENWHALFDNAEDSVAMSWTRSIVEADRALFHAKWSQLLNAEPVTFEMRLTKPFSADEYVGGWRLEGETWVLVTAYTEVHFDGQIKAILGCMIDISRQKWMESFQERRKIEALELKTHQENFMDMTSHEIRNPLAAITLCADSMVKVLQDLVAVPGDRINIGRGTIDNLRDNVETVLACSQHQKKIVDDVLVLSKLGSGLLTIDPISIQPTHIISVVTRIFQTEMEQANISLHVNVKSSYRDLKIDHVLLDPSRILQILINLVSNAIKFTKNRPTRRLDISVDASTVRPDESARSIKYLDAGKIDKNMTAHNAEKTVYISFAVKDTGRGIKDDELDRLFQRFQQGSPKTYSKYGGSGLGLFISKKLTGLQGGRIGVCSQYGVGSIFVFYVSTTRSDSPSTGSSSQNLRDTDIRTQKHNTSYPSVPTQPTKVPTGNLSNQSQHTRTTQPVHDILLVEDNLINQRVLAKQLIQAGFKVTTASHGAEALEHISQSHLCRADGKSLDMVLMDIEMPVMDGLECTRRIRSMEQSGFVKSHIPIVGVSANARDEQQNVAREAGMDTVVAKPFRMPALLEVMGRMPQTPMNG